MAHYRRFVLSFLDKSEYKKSFKEEMICDQMTGETLVRTKFGDIISPDAISRYTSHAQWVESQANMHGFNGELYDLQPDGMEYPSTINTHTNIIDSPVTIPSGITRVIISLDCDCVKVDSDLTKYLEPTVDISVDVSINGVQHTIDSDSSMIGCCLVDVSKLSEGSAETITLDSIMVKSNRPAKDMRIILHSIFIAIS